MSENTYLKKSMHDKGTVFFNRNLLVSFSWRFHILPFIPPHQSRPDEWLPVHTLWQRAALPGTRCSPISATHPPLFLSHICHFAHEILPLGQF